MELEKLVTFSLHYCWVLSYIQSLWGRRCFAHCSGMPLGSECSLNTEGSFPSSTCLCFSFFFSFCLFHRMFNITRDLKETLRQHFIFQKLEISYAICKPFPFLEGLRDKSFISEKMYMVSHVDHIHIAARFSPRMPDCWSTKPTPPPRSPYTPWISRVWKVWTQMFIGRKRGYHRLISSQWLKRNNGSGWVTQLVEALSWYTKVQGSIPSQGTYTNQPMNA